MPFDTYSPMLETWKRPKSQNELVRAKASTQSRASTVQRGLRHLLAAGLLIALVFVSLFG